MTKFIAIKLNYDARAELPVHLKYTKLPTEEEYRRHLERFRADNTGGNGFHECLNFRVSERHPSKIYIPPTCIPSANHADEDFVIFSFTYKGDQALPSSIIGVHAGVRVVSTEEDGLYNPGQVVPGVGELYYHAEAPGELVTLLVPPLPYVCTEGRYTPAFKVWGYGLRYLEASHAAQILTDAIEGARSALPTASVEQQIILQRQLEVLARIGEEYGLIDSNVSVLEAPALAAWAGGGRAPDRETGQAGERYVFEQERSRLQQLGLDPNQVEWISQADPTSVFDIKSVRLVDGEVQPLYLEVKSSTTDHPDVFVSARQIDFFTRFPEESLFALVRFNRQRVPQGLRMLTLDQLHAEFTFEPMKFRLTPRPAIE